MAFRIGHHYTRNQISDELGGSAQYYLPMVDGQVVAACLKPELNPDAPRVVLPGRGGIIESSAEQFAAQSRSRGTAVLPAEVFVVGRAPPPHAVRVCLAAVHDHDRLERGLALLADVLDRGPDPSLTVV